MVQKVKEKTKKDFIEYYGTGKRKNAIARVWLVPGSGKITVNGKELLDYVLRETLVNEIVKPLILTETRKEYDVVAKVKGGGISGQAGAIRHGIAKALLMVNPDFRKPIKQEGMITRDPREKESKKYGRKKARKGFQYRKR